MTFTATALRAFGLLFAALGCILLIFAVRWGSLANLPGKSLVLGIPLALSPFLSSVLCYGAAEVLARLQQISENTRLMAERGGDAPPPGRPGDRGTPDTPVPITPDEAGRMLGGDQS